MTGQRIECSARTVGIGASRGTMEIAKAQAELARAAAQLRAIEKLRRLRKGS